MVKSSKYVACLFSSIVLNLLFVLYIYVYVGDEWNLSWSLRAAAEAEAVAEIDCSGHGIAYLDGLTGDGRAYSDGLTGDGRAYSDGLTGDGRAYSDGLTGDGRAYLDGLTGDGRAYSDGLTGDGRAYSDGLTGDGRAYSDGLTGDGNEPVCECNTCYKGPTCSHLIPHCTADANSGDPLFLEPFWMQHSTSSALVVSGWHRMSYNYNDKTYISPHLERLIRKLHAFVGNAVTQNRYIIFGAGSTQVLLAAAYALSLDNTSSPSPTQVVASFPYYSLYKTQPEYFNPERFKFQGDANTWRNRSDGSANVIEIVTAPNNPDGQLNKAILDGPNVKTIYDRAYYWPHYTPIPSPADEDLMVFTLSKLTGHAGSRFGWAVIKDESVYNRMITHMQLNSLGVSKDTQLRAFKLLKSVLEEGTELFDFAYHKMKARWESLSTTLSVSDRFSLQQNNPQYCSFYNKLRKFSPAYAWLKCEREEDKDCYAVLKAANIIGRQANVFGSEDRYVRLSLLRRQDDFDILIERLQNLASEEDGAGSM